MRALVLATVFASTILSLRQAAAEINMGDAIEWTTADSDLVVVGRVAKLTERQGEGSTTWYRVTVAVTETVKGAPQKSIDLVVRHLYGDSPKVWQTRKSELLLFLIDGKRRLAQDGDCQSVPSCTKTDYDKAAWALHHGRQGDDALALDGSARAFTTAFAVITKRDELLATVRAGAKSTAKTAINLDAPLDSPAGKALYSGSSVWLYVPVDAALETRAVGWIASSDAHERDRGVIVLGHFKSAANIQRLEGLLGDPGWVDVTEGSNPTVRRFFVRKRAHETLLKWGVPHRTPAIDSRVP